MGELKVALDLSGFDVRLALSCGLCDGWSCIKHIRTSGWCLLPRQECKAKYRCPDCNRIVDDARLMSMRRMMQSQMQRSQHMGSVDAQVLAMLLHNSTDVLA